jgi:tripartite-type tricarboxylate transporter receptor subunit TctC
LPDILGDSWVGVLVPARTPKEIAAVLYREIDQIIRRPDMINRLETLGYEPIGNTPEAFSAEIKVELGKWADVVRAANINAK